MSKEIAKKLGLSEEATEEEIIAKIEADQKELTEVKDSNKSLVKTNETLASSEAGLKERNAELEKNYREVLEKSHGEPEKPKSDIEKLIDLK